MKGIILAGGKGTRLYPMTKVISKQLLPIYDKPLIYYPLSTLMLAGIRDILIITTPECLTQFKTLLGDGSKLNLNLSYAVQNEPKGIAEAFIIGENFIGKDNVCLILGDNFFYGQEFTSILENAVKLKNGAMIFAIKVKNPNDFGILEFDDKLNIISIEEKPKKPKSNLAIPGLYFFDNNCIKYAKEVVPSSRGELEIISIIEKYLLSKKLNAQTLCSEITWLDTGTPSGLNTASNLVKAIQCSQGFYIGCLEEIAYNQGYISYKELQQLGKEMNGSEYGKYIFSLEEK